MQLLPCSAASRVVHGSGVPLSLQALSCSSPEPLLEAPLTACTTEADQDGPAATSCRTDAWPAQTAPQSAAPLLPSTPHRLLLLLPLMLPPPLLLVMAVGVPRNLGAAVESTARARQGHLPPAVS